MNDTASDPFFHRVLSYTLKGLVALLVILVMLTTGVVITLRYDPDSLGTVQIDWEDIMSVTTAQYVEVETESGHRYYGAIELSEAVNTIAVGFGEDVDVIAKNEVIRIVPIATNENFVKRLEGTFSLGFVTDKSTGVTQGRITSNIKYRTTDYLVGLNLDSISTVQDSADNTKRHNLGLNYERFRENRWFTDWTLTAEQNDELSLDLRISVGAGLGRYLVQTNQNQFSVVLGLVATRESFISDESSVTNAEGRLSVKYLHRSLVPESNITFSTNVFPLLEDLSSFRAETNLTFRREFVKDLFLDLSFYHTYLSDPVEGSDSSDYGVSTSLGYEF